MNQAVQNYTPLDLRRFSNNDKKSDLDVTFVFLLLITVTLVMLAAVLFLLIKKQLMTDLAYPFT